MPGGLAQIPAALLAGQVTEPSVTYVSPPLVEDDDPAQGAGKQPGSKGDDDQQGGRTGGPGGSDPVDPPDLPASGGEPSVDDAPGPLDDIVGGLTGQGGEQASGGGGGGGVVDDTVDAVEDVIEILDDPLLP